MSLIFSCSLAVITRISLPPADRYCFALRHAEGLSVTKFVFAKFHRNRTMSQRLRAYFSVYYYTKCVLLKAHCATLKMKMCNINFMLGIKTGAAECLLNSPNAKFLYFQGLLLIP